VPATQGTQDTGADPPGAAEYLPGMQAVQAEVPVVSAEYAPEAHPVHTADVAAVAWAPYAPAAHEVQPDDPVVRALYVPAAHGAQEVPLVQYKPPGHVHTTALAVADADLEAAEVVLPDADEVWVAVGAPVPERMADPDPDDEAVSVGAAGREAELEGEALPDPVAEGLAEPVALADPEGVGLTDPDLDPLEVGVGAPVSELLEEDKSVADGVGVSVGGAD